MGDKEKLLKNLEYVLSVARNAENECKDKEAKEFDNDFCGYPFLSGLYKGALEGMIIGLESAISQYERSIQEDLDDLAEN